MDITILIILYTNIVLASSIKVIDSNEDSQPEQTNTTKLLPIIPQEVDHQSSEATTWKLDTSYGESSESDHRNVSEKDTSTENKDTSPGNPGTGTKVFNPSTHLGNIIEDDVVVRPEYGYYDSYGDVKRPVTGFKSPTTTKGFDWSYDMFPYRVETPIITRAKNNIWRPNAVSEYKPTSKPYEVPAGGLYQLQDPFREKPTDDGEQFGIQYHTEVKDAVVKKRMNPWKDLMRLLTAFIPVGLIISALTPNIITIESTGGSNQYPVRVRRSSVSIHAPAPISEICKRRLLCELYADKYYQMNKSLQDPEVTSECVKFRCKDLNSVKKLIYWLLTRHIVGSVKHSGNDT